MTKIYLAGGISDKDRKNGQAVTAAKIRDMGFEVYAAAENNEINDKSNDPTPLDIYNGDINRVKESDIFVVRISGGNEDGTLSEIGMVAGWNECIEENGWKIHSTLPIKIVAYTTNERMLKPQFWNGIASGGFNHLVAGMISRWGVFVGTEKNMLDYLMELKNKNE